MAQVLALATVAAGMSWALRRPWGTFSLNSLHFWADSALVVVMWVAVLLAALAAWLVRPKALAALLCLPPGGFIGAAALGSFQFPTASRGPWGALFLLAALWLLATARLVLSTRVALVGLLVGAAGGALHVQARVPPPVATHPGHEPLPPQAETNGAVVLACGHGSLHLKPLLAMQATSADGFWPGLSKKDELEGEPSLTGDGRRAWLTHTADSVDALTVLPHEVSSHLNRYTDLRLGGVTHPRLRFEGQAEPVDFHVFDYPRGRVAWFAYLSHGEVVVAHGSDAEKGPFVRVATAPLTGERLAFTLYDGEEPLCTVAFLDFVGQADSSNESPAAGEGVPPNVIQFGIPGTGDPIPVIHLSLAETGIGAGRDTVRHAAGTYRNRLRVSTSSGGGER